MQSIVEPGVNPPLIERRTAKVENAQSTSSANTSGDTAMDTVIEHIAHHQGLDSTFTNEGPVYFIERYI